MPEINDADSLKAAGVPEYLIKAIKATIAQRLKLKMEEEELAGRISLNMTALSGMLKQAGVPSYTGPEGTVSLVAAGLSTTFDRKKLASKLLLEGLSADRVAEVIKECLSTKEKAGYAMFRKAAEAT
jgi:hypothetical protein